MSIKLNDLLKKSIEREFNPQETLWLLTHNKSIWWSWGSRDISQYKDKAIFFRVSGALFNGWVLITLGWNDTYTIRLCSTQWNEKERITDVYFDDLVDILDSKIETPTK